jgi:VWFA-related protein
MAGKGHRPAIVGVVAACVAVVPVIAVMTAVAVVASSASSASSASIAPGAAQKPSPPPRTTFVELDAVVVDSHDKPVRGLHRDDFRIKEDGGAVAITSFSEISVAGINGPSDGRSVVLLLDDTIGPAGTSIMQSIARLFLSRARPADAVSVVRLTHHEDEAFGALSVALNRVDEYQSNALPYFGRETIEDALAAVTSISKQVEPAHRRTAIICIGRREVCDPYLDTPEYSLVWPYWRDALSAAARAHASVYVVDPQGVGAAQDMGDGLVDHTGGTDFVRSNDFTRGADAIWNEAGHYYLLGYTPTAKPRELHEIEIKMKPRGLRVRTHLNRGD